MDRELKMRELSANYNILADIFTCPLRYGNLNPSFRPEKEKCQAACSAICFQFRPPSHPLHAILWYANQQTTGVSGSVMSPGAAAHGQMIWYTYEKAYLGKYTPARELFSSSSASCNLSTSTTTNLQDIEVYQQQQHCHQRCHRPRSFPFQKVSIVVALNSMSVFCGALSSSALLSRKNQTISLMSNRRAERYVLTLVESSK